MLEKMHLILLIHFQNEYVYNTNKSDSLGRFIIIEFALLNIAMFK